jgi:flagellar biosynthetic protein FlhB
MSEGSDGAEKNHEPTPQKLEQAREKGDVAKSADLAVAAAYLGLLAALLGQGEEAVLGAAETLTIFLSSPDLLAGQFLGPGGPALSAEIIGRVAAAVSPLFIVPTALVLVAYIAQRAIAPSLTKIEPKLSRISLLSNAKNKFGLTGMVEFAKTLVKMSAVTAALTFYLMARTDYFIGMFIADPRAVPAEIMRIGVGLLSVICAIAAVIGAADAAWQHFDHRRKLRMSDQDLREEYKQSEGDPHMKGERQRRGREIATNRMLADVPKADVVVVNPTHYAVALKWARVRGAAPVCVAKGTDEIAARIREAAIAAGVPIHADPPTARLLHAEVEIGREIKPDHYAAVAAAIRFADQMRAHARKRGW